MNPEWVRDIRDQCIRANVPFFFKQWGGQFKKRTGRVLDGRRGIKCHRTSKHRWSRSRSWPLLLPGPREDSSMAGNDRREYAVKS